MSITIKYPFDESDNYDFDNNKIEVVISETKLVAIVVGAEAYMYTKLDTNKGLVVVDSSGNDRHGAFQGGLNEDAWVTGKINSAIAGKGSGYLNFNEIAIFERTDSFSFECWIKFTSTSTQLILSKQKNTGTFAGYNISLVLGKIRFSIRDESNNKIDVETNVTYNDGSFHHVVGTYDGTSLVTGMKLYVDNTKNFSTVTADTLSDIINNVTDFQISGRDGNNQSLAVGSVVDEILIYARELSDAEVAFRWNTGDGTQTIPGASTSFSTDNPFIYSPLFIQATKIDSFATDETVTGSDEVRYVLVINGTETWWSGSAWVESTGYSETNTQAEISANLSSLVLSEASVIGFLAYLHSDDGTTTPILSDITIGADYTNGLNLNDSIVWNYLLDLSGDPIESEIIKVRSGWIVGDQVITSDDWIQTITLASGFWQINMKIDDTEPDFLEWIFKRKMYKTNFLIGIHKFSELTILEESDDFQY